MVKIIGSFKHPQQGLYHIYFDGETGCYGLGRVVTLTVRCDFPTLEAAMNAKGF